ncbi:MAG: hypothetical protein AUG91_06655 [Actinobacteria bacterium 13_1_20CM_4_69_9]|nr:MAG: hypothetical protein AUG91_06655 [Actinobacteria bacterium 13_1_20CM_4_69_9]
MRTSSRPIAVVYAATRRSRTDRSLTRPSGKARKTCRKTTGVTRSSAWPTVKGTASCAQTSVPKKFVKPAAIISGPKRLAGRRHQASRPHRTYESVSKTLSIATTSGSPS